MTFLRFGLLRLALAIVTCQSLPSQDADADDFALLAQRARQVKKKEHVKIPAIVHFNYKFNLFDASEERLQAEPLLRILKRNIEHTVELFGTDVPKVNFWDDKKCIRELKKLKRFNGHQLAKGFASLVHGKYKSDLCRLAQLYKYGGYYFDLDILPVKSMRKYLDPDTTFASVRSMCHKEIFQAFLAATPKNPLIALNLKTFGTWLATRKKGHEPENIGPLLMWRSFRKTGAKFKRAPQFFVGDEKVQLFQENRIKKWKHGKETITGLLSGHSKWGECNIAVVDQNTDEVVMYPRVISANNDDACAEEKKLIIQHFLEKSHSVLD